jgi:hypothetical protein
MKVVFFTVLEIRKPIVLFEASSPLLLVLLISLVLRYRRVWIISENTGTRTLPVPVPLSDNISHMAGAGSSPSMNCLSHDTALAR